jgi:ketosteroid isomerase-like protein
MKLLIPICLLLISSTINAGEFDADQFAKDYFNAWAATQSPAATSGDIEHYLSFLTEDVGHQHLPYDPDDTRSPDGKENMREGMSYYLGAHTEYSGELISHTVGHDVVVIKYKTSSKGTHPQTKEVIAQSYLTMEVLEIENGKVSVIRKYSD